MSAKLLTAIEADHPGIISFSFQKFHRYDGLLATGRIGVV